MSARNSTTSPITREFLGWDRPALPEAALRLAARYRRGQNLDLARVIVVVPGQRAGRRLQELLVYLAEDQKLCLTPPNLVTEGHLPELLYPPQRPFANDIVQDLAWAQALRELPEDLRRYLLLLPPADGEGLRWLELGKVLRRLHLELTADCLNFANVAEAGRNLTGFTESERWRALAQAQRRYLDLLDEHQLWDRETARLKAIEKKEIATDCDIVLLATVDLNDTLRRMLEQIAERVTVYIVAPEEMAERFDRLGCLVPSAWCEADVPLKDEQLLQVDGPEDQADAVSRWLAELNEDYGTDQIAIGVPDATLAPQLQRQLAQCKSPARWVEMIKLADSAPYRLLAAAAEYAARRRYDDLAAVIRHPDVEDWLQRAGVVPRGGGSLANQLDQFYMRHLPSFVSAEDLKLDEDDWPDLPAAVQYLEECLAAAAGTHTLRAWSGVFQKVLANFYERRELNLDKPGDETLHAAFRKILQALDRLDDIPETFDTFGLTADDALCVVLGPSASEPLPPPASQDALELLGWLELPLDDAPALVVTSFNEGFVPEATGAESFLPDQLRRELGVLHNERRYARDAYATTVLCKSRERLRVIFARRDTKRDPLQPSRLLFACPDAAMVRRARQYFGERSAPTPERRLLLAGDGPIPTKSDFVVPSPVKRGRKLPEISVTRFKAYLACRYRYYLRFECALNAVDDSARELDGAAFGNLIHVVLGAYGRDTLVQRHSERARDIVDSLVERLNARARALYGPELRRPVIRLQLEQARMRLTAFAECQAEQIRDGWQIVYAENEKNGTLQCEFMVDNEPIQLVGRIDRIDFHPLSRKLRILDYKTGDSALTPDQSHRKKEEWLDLQLPLYRHLWRKALPDFAPDCQVQLGYFNLPKKLDETRVELAHWDEALLKSADELARQVIRNLRSEDFWPPAEDGTRAFGDEFATICLEDVFGAATREQDGEGEPE